MADFLIHVHTLNIKKNKKNNKILGTLRLFPYICAIKTLYDYE